MADKKVVDEKKQTVSDDELEKVTGGAIAGIQFVEPAKPYTPVNTDAIAVSNGLQNTITPGNPINKGNPIKTS